MPSTIGLWRWARSHSFMAFLINESLGETNWLVNRLFSVSVHDERISFSFFWIDPSSINPSTFFLSKRTDAPLWIRSSIKVRQKVSIPPNFPRQGASIRIFRFDRSVKLPEIQPRILPPSNLSHRVAKNVLAYTFFKVRSQSW